MTKAKKTKKNEPVTEFDVDSAGTLMLAGFAKLENRSEFYEYVADFWFKSPVDLAEAIDECQPLAWAVHSIYTDVRDEIQSDLNGISGKSKILKKRVDALKERLNTMPEEPEDGTEHWLLTLTSSEFKKRVVPEIEEWFNSPPEWDDEEGYLPECGTSQGAALNFFEDMSADDLKTIGVVVIEGEHTGSTYYAAEMRIDIEAANKAAAEAGIPVRFKR